MQILGGSFSGGGAVHWVAPPGVHIFGSTVWGELFVRSVRCCARMYARHLALEWREAKWRVVPCVVGLLVCWFVGLLACWFAGLLVCWFVGLLVCWFVGLLVRWFVGSLVCWCVGSLVCWFVGLLVCWFVGLLVCWFAGLLVR